MSAATPRRRRLVGVRLACLEGGGERAYVEYRLDATGTACAVVGSDTKSADLHRMGVPAPRRGIEGRLAMGCSGRLGIPFEAGRRYGRNEGAQFLVCLLAFSQPRSICWDDGCARTALPTHGIPGIPRSIYWAEAIVVEDGVERTIEGWTDTTVSTITPILRVLVAIVDQGVRESITRALQRDGIAVEQAADVERARDVVKRGQVNTVVADLHMAAIGDIGTLVKAAAAPMPIILVAAVLTPDLRDRALALGVASVHSARSLDLARLVADVEDAAARGAAPR